MRKLALKRLKESDLSFFKSHFEANDQSKQKGFNLDTSVMQGGAFYPSLKTLLEPLPKKAAHVDLIFFGPGLSPAYQVARKVKIDAKNLRLNGELVHDPDGEPGRFSTVSAGDFAVFEFDGFPLPTEVKVVLIAKSNASDTPLHAECTKILPRESDSMREMSEADLQSLIDAASPDARHPIRDWLDPVLLEELGSGSAQATSEVNKRRRARGISAAELQAAKEAAARVGAVGEELLNGYFESGVDTTILSHVWVAQENAISPNDFSLTMVGGEARHADAKSTSGGFATPLHLSMAEIFHVLASGIPYDIYRLYAVGESGALMRVVRDIRPQLEPLAEHLKTLPVGVRPDSFSFDPAFFNFDSAVVTISV